jgi:SAM-dependent methyltransferase
VIAGQRTKEAYWSQLWGREPSLPPPIDISDQTIGNTATIALHDFFRAALTGVPRGSRFLELGCAQSRWLPFFGNEFGLRVEGLDYSAVGCAKARELLARTGVEGRIHHADLFAPPSALIGRFDVVASFGLIEHFDDTAGCIQACSRFVRPGGRLITTIPNMRGSVGMLQRALDRKVFDLHVPLRPREVAATHAEAGLEVVHCAFLMSAHWAVVSFGRRFGPRAHGGLRRLLKSADRVVWALERAGLRLPPNQLTSPYIGCFATKPDHTASTR